MKFTQFKQKENNMKSTIASVLALAAGASAFTAPSLPTAAVSTTKVAESKVRHEVSSR
jgi:hypothetical protein